MGASATGAIRAVGSRVGTTVINIVKLLIYLGVDEMIWFRTAMFVGSIAAISLLVGGIGIMNVMLTTVTERTREIGIRRATGATRRAIRRQFLTESVVISSFGGVTGIGLGLVLGWIIHLYLRYVGAEILLFIIGMVYAPWGSIAPD